MDGYLKARRMRGTIVCGVVDTCEGRAAVAVAVDLCERLGLRLVLAHVTEGAGSAGRATGAELLARVAAEHGVAGTAERREAYGDAATRLGQIAAEEAADLILVGHRARGRLRGRFGSDVAKELEAETAIPVFIAPPSRRRGARAP
jgi:nucleotide-binding universal stress UspA family protein